MTRLTLEEVAEQAGVSRSTVSRVLNGGSVAPPTRQKVLEYIDAAGYTPNLAARRLAKGRTGILGFVFHEDASDLFGDPYFSALLKGMTDAAAQEASGVMLWLDTHEPDELVERVRSVGLIDGVVVTANFVEDLVVDGLLDSGLPVVLVGRGGHGEHANWIDIDHVDAATHVVSYLIGLGHRRIGHITGVMSSVSARDRLAGYRLALSRAGIPTDDALVVEGLYDEESGYEAAKPLIDRGITALFAANDRMALGAYQALEEAGLEVPADVSVIGFDDLDIAAEADVPLTTVRQPVRQMGETATTTLLERINAPGAAPHQVVFPTELVVRSSTAGVGANSHSGSGER